MVIGVYPMFDNGGVFRTAIKRKFPSEGRIIDAFLSSDARHITESLGELIGQNEQKYQKVVDIIASHSVADEKIHSKWESVQGQLNETFFGFITWDNILRELDGERAKQDAVIQSTARQQEALRTRIPTSLIAREQKNKPSLEIQVAPKSDNPPAPSNPPFETQENCLKSPERRSTQPPPPSSKNELLEHLDILYDQKKRELDGIHDKKIALINAHGEKLLHDAVDDFLSRIRRLEAVKKRIDAVFTEEISDPFLSSLCTDNTRQIQDKILELREEQTRRQDAINKYWQSAVENEETRNLDMLSQLDAQIRAAREMYNRIEDSGMLDLQKTMHSSNSVPWNDLTTSAYVKECKTRLLSDHLDEAALKHMRDTLLYLWNQTTDTDILVDIVNIFGFLLFSHLAPQSKGKLISVLIETMHTRSLVESATMLQLLADNDGLCYRLSARDMKRLLSLVESQNDEIRNTTVALIERQLQLEEDGLVPISSSALSQKLSQAIAYIKPEAESRRPLEATGSDPSY